MTTSQPFNAAASTPDQQLFAEATASTPDLAKMKSLIDGGANVNAADDKGNTVLMHAVLKRRKGAAALLLDNGADVYAREHAQKSDVMAYAVATYDLDIVRMLLDKGYDANRDACRDTMSPLMWAANMKQDAIAEELARRGADINAKSSQGWTAMDYAENNNRPFLSKKLRAIGAEMDAKARQREIARQAEAEQQRRDAEKAALDAVCDAGLPTHEHVRAMKPLKFKARRA